MQERIYVYLRLSELLFWRRTIGCSPNGESCLCCRSRIVVEGGRRAGFAIHSRMGGVSIGRREREGIVKFRGERTSSVKQDYRVSTQDSIQITSGS